MCGNHVWRALWMGAFVLLLTGGVASAQTFPFPGQNVIAWGGPIQPDVTRTDTPAQPVVPLTLSQTPADGSTDNPPSDSADGNQSAGQSNQPADNTASTASDSNVIRQLGTPFPLELQPQGLKIGPFYMPNISDSFIFAVNSVPGQPTETFAGDSIATSLVYSHNFNNGGVLAVQAHEQFSVSQLHPYFNQAVGATYNQQLTERWTLNANAAFTYFQNSILANPQYILSYQNGGIVQQTAFTLQTGYTMYESNNIALSYSLNGRTHLTLSPILGATFLEQQGGWTSTHQFGGGVGISRDFTPNLNAGVFYSISHSVTSGIAGSPSWNGQGFGFSMSYKFLNSWSLSASLAASGQVVAQVWTLTPTGSLTLMKAFRRSSVYGAYSRSEAGNIIVSTGYFDQADIGYSQKFSQKLSFNAGAGQYRTINTFNRLDGKHIGGSVSYQWTPRVSLNAGYSYAHQTGVQNSTFSPFLGNTSFFSAGVNWLLGSHSGL